MGAVRVMWQMANDIPEIVPEPAAKVLPGTRCVRAIGAFEVDVLDERELGVLWSADVVDFRINGWCEHHRQICRLLSPAFRSNPENQPTKRGSEHHRDQHADGRLPTQVGRRAEREADHQERHGEPDPRKRRAAKHAAHPDTLGKPTGSKLHSDEGGETDAEKFAEHETHDDSPRHGGLEGIDEHAAAQVDASVREREDRDDDERGRHAQDLVHAFIYRDTSRQASIDCAGRCRARRLPEVAEQLTSRDHLVPTRRVGGDKESCDHAREGGVDSGINGREPEHNDNQHVRCGAPLPRTTQKPQPGEAGNCDQQRNEPDLVAVENADDGDGEEVIDDGEGE